jgi:hypothetical protein
VTGVGIIVNPWAGKDVRRLHAPVGHTPDTAKVGIVRRIALGALESGAERVVAARDVGRIAERAIAGIDGAVLIDGPNTGSALDTRRAAAQLGELGCSPLVVLGGDGTCRDVAMGAPDCVMIAVSTGTNNVFPLFVDGSSAGTAAGLVASGGVEPSLVGRRAKLLHVEVRQPDGSIEHDIALVDVALTDDLRTGARAVVRPESILAVVAAIASPVSTGLSAIAGRVHPVDRHAHGAVAVRVGGDRRVRVPILPGSFDVVAIASVEPIPDGGSIELVGPGTLAYDGERDRLLRAGATAIVTVRSDGPVVIDVDRALHCAARQRRFDVAADGDPTRDTGPRARRADETVETPHGD